MQGWRCSTGINRVPKSKRTRALTRVLVLEQSDDRSLRAHWHAEPACRPHSHEVAESEHLTYGLGEDCGREPPRGIFRSGREVRRFSVSRSTARGEDRPADDGDGLSPYS